MGWLLPRGGSLLAWSRLSSPAPPHGDDKARLEDGPAPSPLNTEENETAHLHRAGLLIPLGRQAVSLLTVSRSRDLFALISLASRKMGRLEDGSAPSPPSVEEDETNGSLSPRRPLLLPHGTVGALR